MCACVCGFECVTADERRVNKATGECGRRGAEWSPATTRRAELYCKAERNGDRVQDDAVDYTQPAAEAEAERLRRR